MVQAISLKAERRERAGKGAARATRRAGMIPGVIYGDHKEPVMISVDPKDLHRHIHQHGFFTKVFEIGLGGDTYMCLPRDLQLHPVTDKPLHVDFLRFGKGTTLRVFVEVKFLNDLKSPGIKRGGVLNVVRHEVELICAPENIPQVIEIDLTGLEINDSVHISSVKLPEGVKPVISERDFTIATIAPPSVMKMEAKEAAAAAASASAAEAEAAAAPAAGAAPAAAGAAKAPAAGAAPAKAPAAKK